MKTGLLNNKCGKCEKYLGSMENYGTEETKLCFDCANKLKCESCGEVVPVSEQLYVNNQLLCNDCRKITESVENASKESTDDLMEISSDPIDDPVELPAIQLPATFKIRPEMSPLIFISAVLLLPTAGGVIEAFRFSFSNLNLTHYICLLMYAFYPVYLYLIHQKRVILHEERVEIHGIISRKEMLINTIIRIDNVLTPKGRIFAWDKTYKNILILVSASGKTNIKIDQMKNQKVLIDYLVVKSNCPYDKVHQKRGMLHWLLGG